MNNELAECIYDLERAGRYADADALRQQQQQTTPGSMMTLNPPDKVADAFAGVGPVEPPPHDIRKLRALYASRLLPDAGFVGTRRNG